MPLSQELFNTEANLQIIELIVINTYSINYQWRPIQYNLVQNLMLLKYMTGAKKPIQSNMDIQNPQKEDNVPWVQKYRPNTLNDLSYQLEVTHALKNIVKGGNIPHLLFYGPAGTGKTSAIIAMAKEIFGRGFYKQRILELNASDQRGINVIRQKVKSFAVKVAKKNLDKNNNCPNVKIVILDEADLLTNDAQSALRRIIQDNSTTTRFCIICNYITKIIQPLASRCIKFRFKSIPSNAQFEKLLQICEKENISLDRKNLELLVQKGDLRQSINSLQSLSKIQNISQYILPISTETCEAIFENIVNCQTIKQVFRLAEDVKYEGYAMDEIINGLLKGVLKMPIEKDQHKAILLQSLSKSEQQMQLGSIQLPIVDLFTNIFYLYHLRI